MISVLFLSSDKGQVCWTGLEEIHVQSPRLLCSDRNVEANEVATFDLISHECSITTNIVGNRSWNQSLTYSRLAQ